MVLGGCDRGRSLNLYSLLLLFCNFFDDAFLSNSPFRFIVSGFFTIHDFYLTVINIVALLVGVVPKLPFFHGFRLQQKLMKE